MPTTNTSAPSVDSAVQILNVTGVALKAFVTVAEAARGVLVSADTSSEITAVLKGLVGLADAVSRGLSTHETPASIEASIKELADSLAGNNAAIDAKLDADFPVAKPAQ